MNKKCPILWLLLVVGLPMFMVAQSDSLSNSYPPINENLLVESKWKYTYITHAETDLRIHQADEAYQFYIHFKYDYTYEQYLNGEFQTGSWYLNSTKNEIFYNFRNVNWWQIAELGKETLIIEFTLKANNSTYRYHFVKLKDSEDPFPKIANVFETIPVNGRDIRDNTDTRIKAGDKSSVKSKPSPPTTPKPVYIEIALIGGGYYGGPDPVLKDYIIIKNNGRVIKEYESLQRGLVKSTKQISREELEQLATFIISKNFFNYKRLYDCETQLCHKRKSSKPIPIPLRLSVRYGTRYKVVTITVWGLDRRNVGYVDYPEYMDIIIKSIQSLTLD